MISILELTVDQTNIIAIILPVVVVCFFTLLALRLRRSSRTGIWKYLSYLIKPPRIGKLNPVTTEISAEQRVELLQRELKVRLFFVYLGLAIFLISFMIGEFYEVMFDLLLPVTQGSTGDTRTISSVVFQSPFNAGWLGAMPWYGRLPAPSNFDTYHETWSWILFTSAITDNPNFLGTTVTVLLLISFVMGLVFLAPLAVKTIRHSFLPSMFFFMTGMTIFSKVAFGCLAQALALAYGNISIEYGILIVTGDMIPDLSEVIAIGILVVLAIFALFTILGWKLWKVHYSEAGPRFWFMVFIAVNFWIGFALEILLV